MAGQFLPKHHERALTENVIESFDMDFSDLNFEDFKRLALSDGLTDHEKVGFPDDYRKDRESAIFDDILAKLPKLSDTGKKVVEIGPGCGPLPQMLAELAEKNKHDLVFLDSDEMLSQLPDYELVTKISGKFPDECCFTDESHKGRYDVVLAYSVLQYIFSDGDLWQALDLAMSLLAPGGRIMFGDVPNVAMRRRFLSGPAGREFHRAYFGDESEPTSETEMPDMRALDDSVIFSILLRARSHGFHSWVTPQADSLPMANRREDIIIERP